MDHFSRSRSSSWWIAHIPMEITDVVEDWWITRSGTLSITASPWRASTPTKVSLEPATTTTRIKPGQSTTAPRWPSTRRKPCLLLSLNNPFPSPLRPITYPSSCINQESIVETVELNWIMVCLLLVMELLMGKIILRLRILGDLLGDHRDISILLGLEMGRVNVGSWWLLPILLHDLNITSQRQLFKHFIQSINCKY